MCGVWVLLLLLLLLVPCMQHAAPDHSQHSYALLPSLTPFIALLLLPPPLLAAAASMWQQLVTSLKLHLWSSSGSDSDSGLARELLVQDLLDGNLSNKPRSFFVRHYARGVNLAFAQVRGCHQC
jgi:hypothetical protein